MTQVNKIIILGLNFQCCGFFFFIILIFAETDIIYSKIKNQNIKLHKLEMHCQL